MAVEMADEIVPNEPATIVAATRRFDMRALWRLAALGRRGCAGARRSPSSPVRPRAGSQRLAAVASADPPMRPGRHGTIPPRRRAANGKSRAWKRNCARSTADRDRLAARVASLEHNLDDITGSIKRQAAQPIDAARSAEPPPRRRRSAPPATTDGQRRTETPRRAAAAAAHG